ncbi:transposase [Streptomyces coelicoflavus]|uniref:IS110 family transposase n=1 Tax=Streptomyces coelicoflavus TaxID=285562 RepID=UPI00369DC1C2
MVACCSRDATGRTSGSTSPWSTGRVPSSARPGSSTRRARTRRPLPRVPRPAGTQVARNGHGDRGREHPVRRSLAASGLDVVHVDPTRAARHTLARGISKTDRADARLIASMTLAGEYRPLVGHSPQAETLRVVAHAHRAAVADRTEALHCRRAALMRFWPAAVSAWPTSVGGLRSPQARAVLAAAPTRRPPPGLTGPDWRSC